MHKKHDGKNHRRAGAGSNKQRREFLGLFGTWFFFFHLKKSSIEKKKSVYIWEQETFFKKLVCRKSGEVGKLDFIGVGCRVAQSGGGKNVPGGDWDFMGEGSVPYNGKAWFGTNFVDPGPDVNPYTFKLRPVDAVDKAAQRHDYYYWKEGATGIQGAILNKSVTYADMILVGDAYNIMQSYRVGGIDEVTGLPISVRTYNIALGVYYSFLPLSINKILP